MKRKVIGSMILAGLGFASSQAMAACSDIDRDALVAAAQSVVPATGTPNGGLGFPMWVTVVDETGAVCFVVNSNGEGHNSSAAWLGSRIISAQKANTANAFSHNKLALSTANLYSAVLDGGSLYGLQHSNPVDGAKAYGGNPAKYGTKKDPIVGKRLGGVNVFGGGLALYKLVENKSVKVGAIGVSGDTSCTDHVVAWKIRDQLGLDNVPVFGSFDKMFQDITDGVSASGFGHPGCLNNPINSEDGGSIDGNLDADPT